MPARKTIAERGAAAARTRNRRLLLVTGAVPIVILAIIASVFLYQELTAFGPDEMPSSISQSDRDDIRKAIDDMYDAVNQYNPQLALEGMRWDERYDRKDVDRFVYEISALLSEQLKFEAQTLGSTTLNEQGEAVTARFVTNFGSKGFVLKRSDGQWRVSQPPDLSVPQEAGPLRLQWQVLNSYRSDDGKRLNIAGTIENTGTQLGFLLGNPAYIADDTGKTIATTTQPLPGSPFIRPGETSYFQVTFIGTAEEIAALDAPDAVFVPDFRPAGPNDEASVLVQNLSVSPASMPWPAGAGASVTVINGDERKVTTRVYGHVLDASGQFLGIYALFAATLDPGEQRSIALPDALPRELSAASLDIRIYGAPGR